MESSSRMGTSISLPRTSRWTRRVQVLQGGCAVSEKKVPC